MKWLKGIAGWQIGRTLYLSVPFTWLLPEARELALAHKGPVQAGGPAVMLMPEQLADVVTVNLPSPVEPLLFHNPLATFTSRGCPNQCGFCAVPRIEGDFREIKDWRPAPVVCDNNLLAASSGHFDQVIDRLKAMPFVDFNQGFESRLLKPKHVRRLAELKRVKVRFAFDHINEERSVSDAITLCRAHGLKDIGIYVLIGYNDTPADAKQRLEIVRGWKIRPNPMRFQALDGLIKNTHVDKNWNEIQLKDMTRYYSRLRFLEHVSFEEYQHYKAEKRTATQQKRR